MRLYRIFHPLSLWASNIYNKDHYGKVSLSTSLGERDATDSSHAYLHGLSMRAVLDLAEHILPPFSKEEIDLP